MESEQTANSNGQHADPSSSETDIDTPPNKDPHSCVVPSLHKDDSGITLEATSSSCKSEGCDDSDLSHSLLSPHPATSTSCVHDTASDVDMSNDFVESLNDSALPSSSSVSESSSDVKYKTSPQKSEDGENGEETALDGNQNLQPQHSPSDATQQKLNLQCVSSDQEKPEYSQSESDTDIGDNNNPSRKKSESFKKKSRPEASVNKDDERRGEENSESTMEGGTTAMVGEVANEDSLPSLSSSNNEENGEDDEHKNSNSYDVQEPNFFSSRLFTRPRQRRRKPGRRVLRLSSDDDSSSSNDDNNNDENDDDDHNDDDDDDEEIHNTDSTTDSDVSEISDNDAVMVANKLMEKTPPLPNWVALRELSLRQYGCPQRQSPSSFNEKVQGSIQMARRLQLVESMKYHEGCVNSLCFNRIGTLLASGSDDLNVVLWNWQRGRPSLIYDSGHRSNVFQAKFMPYSGDCHVVSCARDGQVRLAELSLTGVCKNTRKLAQHRGAAHKLALEYDSANVFLSCGEDAVTFLFDLREERPHKLVTTKENDKKVPLYSIHSNPSDSRQFCVGGRDHYIRVYDKRKIAEECDGGVLKKFCPDHLTHSSTKANVTCACYNYNGTEIVGSYNDEDIYLFDMLHSDGSNFTHRYAGHRNNATVKGVNFYGPRSEFIVSGSDCGNLYIWEKNTEAIITFLEGDRAGVINVLEPHPTLPVLATSGLDHEVKLWMPCQAHPDVDTPRLKKTIVKNMRERIREASAEPSVMSGQMLWMIMHHFRNTARRRAREEGQELSSTEDEDNEDDGGSDDSDATAEMNQCAQS